MESVDREVFLNADPSEVWEAVTSRDELADWFGADVDGELLPGELVRFTWPGGSMRRAIVERVEEPHALVFRWLSTGDDPSGSLPVSWPSRVEITIHEVEDGSVIRVVERTYEAAVSPTPHIGFKALAKV